MQLSGSWLVGRFKLLSIIFLALSFIMASRSRSRSRCNRYNGPRSWCRSRCKHYKVYLTKLNGDKFSYQLPLTVGQIKDKLPRLVANSTYNIISYTTVLEDSHHLEGADYQLNVIIVKHRAALSKEAASDAGLYWRGCAVTIIN